MEQVINNLLKDVTSTKIYQAILKNINSDANIFIKNVKNINTIVMDASETMFIEMNPRSYHQENAEYIVELFLNFNSDRLLNEQCCINVPAELFTHFSTAAFNSWIAEIKQRDQLCELESAKNEYEKAKVRRDKAITNYYL